MTDHNMTLATRIATLMRAADAPLDKDQAVTLHMALVTLLGDESIDEVREAYALLFAENARLRKDAERYRFIRDGDRSSCIDQEISMYVLETLDEYVDAAMEGESQLASSIDAAKETT